MKKLNHKWEYYEIFYSVPSLNMRRATTRKKCSGVNSINILWAAFMCSDSKSAKKSDGLTVFFALLGSALVKASCKKLVKSTLDCTQSFVRITIPLSLHDHPFSIRNASLHRNIQSQNKTMWRHNVEVFFTGNNLIKNKFKLQLIQQSCKAAVPNMGYAYTQGYVRNL